MLASGTLLGRYRLQNPLGSGSTGDVYQAEEVQNGRQVVLKVLRFELPPDTADEAVQLFRREAAKIADLQHPHILPLLDFGDVVVDDTVLFYTVMHQHKGGTLDIWLQQRGSSAFLPPADVVMLLQPIADALGYAHKQQVVHQAVRPTNLLVRQLGNSALPDLLLTDFSFPSLLLTFPSPPSYVAPEQWTGTAVAATDQYSLAAIAYRLLTGNTPFQGTPEQIKQQHLYVPPQPASERLPQLHADIDTVLLIALAKKPQSRYPSITAFTNALQQATQQLAMPASVALPAQPVLPDVQTATVSRPLEQTVLSQPDSLNIETESTQQTLALAQLRPLTTSSTALQQLPPPSTTPPASAETSAKLTRSSLRRDTLLMSLLSLLFLAIIIIAGSSGISVKQNRDQPGIDGSATADIQNEYRDISRYGIEQGDLLTYDPLSNNKAFWASRDNLGTCGISSLFKVLRVTTAPAAVTSTPTATSPTSASQGDVRFHSCIGNDSPFQDSSTPLPNNIIIEVQIRFDKDTSIGGIIFSQVDSNSNEKFFVFSIKPIDDTYSFCQFNSSNETCSTIQNGSFQKALIEHSEEFDSIAVVIEGNVVHQLYLNESPLLSQVQGIQLENQESAQVTSIGSIGVVADVVAKTENSTINDNVELLFKNLKIWKA